MSLRKDLLVSVIRRKEIEYEALRYDPGDGVRFWEAIRQLPGFPANESMPIKEMVFRSNALFEQPKS